MPESVSRRSVVAITAEYARRMRGLAVALLAALLALGRAVCRGACGRPSHTEIWIWRDGSLRRIIGPLHGDQTPMPFAWHNGHLLWWDYPDSGSIAADGVALYENKRRIAESLM